MARTVSMPGGVIVKGRREELEGREVVGGGERPTDSGGSVSLFGEGGGMMTVGNAVGKKTEGTSGLAGTTVWV